MKHLFVRPYPGLIASLFLLTAFTWPAPVHAQPVETGPLGINGSLIAAGAVGSIDADGPIVERHQAP